MALEQRVKLDTEVVAQLLTERDELCHIAERLPSERSVACGEHDQAVRERDEAQ